MFRSFAVALLLINAYSGSLGASINSGVYLEKNNLTELANHCKHQFLSTQITSKVSECTIYMAKTKKEFLCNIFYDINSQLCDAIAASKLRNISKEDQNKLAVDISIDEFCKSIKPNKHTNSTYYKAFEQNNSCIRSCGSDDFTDLNANYYCKYYKWGKDLLGSSQGVTTSIPIHSIVLNTTYLPLKIQEPVKVVSIDTPPRGIISGVTSTVNTSSTDNTKSVKVPSVVKQVEEAHHEDEINKDNEQDDLETNIGGECLVESVQFVII